MNNRDMIYAFIAGVLIGMYLSDLLAVMQYRDSLSRIPEFLKEEGDK